ncbi:hypothetical protein Droror1_Dr00012566 [Drosera rotundifolia]
MSSYQRRRIAMVTAIIVLILFVTVAALMYGHGLSHLKSFIVSRGIISAGSSSSSPHRKLLHRSQTVVEPTRIWGDIQRCSDGDLVVTQGPTSPLPSGIPTYTVEINNACVTGCDISHIHLRCGWFSSARLVNPHIFKRLRFNDCLVNNGQPLGNGQTITFQYANTFSYPLSISSMHCS